MVLEGIGMVLHVDVLASVSEIFCESLFLAHIVHMVLVFHVGIDCPR